MTASKDFHPLSKDEARAAAARLRSSVPDAMRALPHWLLWKLEPGEKKPKKMPYYLSGKRRTGEQGSEKDRAALVSFEAAVVALESGRCSGVGFAFLPGDGLIGIDIDAAIDLETGEVSERAQAIIARCASYTEYSPSRRGVHIIVAGVSETFKSNDIGLEVFCGRQFFTVTGEPYPGGAPQVAPIDEKVLRRLRVTVDSAKVKKATRPAATNTPVTDKRAELESALAFVSADCDYNTWIDIGITLYAELGDSAGLAVWEWWSGKGSKFQGSADLATHWRSFAGKSASAGVYKLARDAGWRPPRRAKPDLRNEPLTPEVGKTGPRVVSPTEPAHWSRGLRRNEDGAIRNTPANVDLILRNDAPWKGLLAYDEFGYRVMKLRAPAFEGGRAGPWEETDATKAAIWIERVWGLPAKSKVVDEIVRSIAWDARYNSVRDWLESLRGKWDGTERLPTFMQDAFGAVQNDYTEHIGIGLLVTAVARIYRPGCKVDTMVVLEGGQGIGKSTAIIELFSPALYVDIIDPPSHKDFYITLQNAWCVEIGEMQAFNRSEVNQVKQAITRRDDKFRAPYDKTASDHPRQSIFVGTTNADTYLMDPSGGRRFLPVRCTAANVVYVRAMREQLFAEAIERFDAHFRWWDFPQEQAQHEQDQRYVDDSWGEPITAWLAGHGSDSAFPDTVVRGDWDKSTDRRPVMSATTTDIMHRALGIDVSKHTRQDQMRVGQIMRRLGWEKAPQLWNGGKPVRPWVRPPSDVPVDDEVPI